MNNFSAVRLVPVAPQLETRDFEDVELLYEKLSRAVPEDLESAPSRVLVFPEYIGLGFYLTAGGNEALSAKSLMGAMGNLTRLRKRKTLWNFFRTYLDFFIGPAGERLKRAVFQTYASEAWQMYHEVFSNLAEAHHSWVVAGSILSPPVVGSEIKWRVKGSELLNRSVVYNPTGSITGVVPKLHLTPFEKGFVNPGEIKNWRVIPTEFGNLAVFICADCWYPELYAEALAQSATHYAVPAMVNPQSAWNEPWQGYQPRQSTPADVPAGLEGQITEAAAWLKFGLAGRLENIRHGGGVVSQFQGHLLDLSAYGESMVMGPGNPAEKEN